MMFQRQDSTSDQLDDVALWAEGAGHAAAAAWVRDWEDYHKFLSDKDFTLLCAIAIAHGCYDASDAIKRRVGSRRPSPA